MMEAFPFQRNYFSVLKEQANHLLNDIDFELKKLESRLNRIFSIQEHRLNEVMKTLTVISVIFIPITFLTGLYGMNFEYIPELQYKNGYFVLLFVMFSIVILNLWFINRKKWF